MLNKINSGNQKVPEIGPTLPSFCTTKSNLQTARDERRIHRIRKDVLDQEKYLAGLTTQLDVDKMQVVLKWVSKMIGIPGQTLDRTKFRKAKESLMNCIMFGNPKKQ